MLKCTQLIKFKDDEFGVVMATTLEDTRQLPATGFDYVTEMKGIKLLRKPKRFGMCILNAEIIRKHDNV